MCTSFAVLIGRPRKDIAPMKTRLCLLQRVLNPDSIAVLSSLTDGPPAPDVNDIVYAQRVFVPDGIVATHDP